MVKKAKLCYMDIESFTVYVTANDIYKDIVEVIETRFDPCNYELNKPQLKGKTRKLAV